MLLAPNIIIVGIACSHCNMLVLMVSIFVFGVVAVFVFRRLFVVTVDRVFFFPGKGSGARVLFSSSLESLRGGTPFD